MSGLDGLLRVYCVECCARARLESLQPGAHPGEYPVATRIYVLRDANTLEPVI